MCFVFDLVYVGLVVWAKRRPGGFTVLASPAGASLAPEGAAT
jgi:hypothetical protein